MASEGPIAGQHLRCSWGVLVFSFLAELGMVQENQCIQGPILRTIQQYGNDTMFNDLSRRQWIWFTLEGTQFAIGEECTMAFLYVLSH